MALNQLHWSSCHTHKICTSERNWPSSWTCVCLGAPALHRGSKASSCNWRWRMLWSAGCTCGAKSIGLFAIQKKSDAKIASWAVVASKLDSRMFSVLLRCKSEGWTNKCHERTHGTEQGPFSDSFDPTCNYFAAFPIS